MLQRYRRKLAGSQWTDETFKNEDLRNSIADGSTFQNCSFLNCKMGQASFRGSAFAFCHFDGCDLRQAVLICRLVDSTFVDCDLDQALFHSAIIERTHFEKSRLEYSVFSRATIIGGGFVDCQLHGAYFDLAESSGVDFSGSNLWGLLMPLSCAVIPENRFDHRQIHMLMALASRSAADPKEIALLRSVTDPKILALVDRLVERQSGEAQEKYRQVG